MYFSRPYIFKNVRSVSSDFKKYKVCSGKIRVILKDFFILKYIYVCVYVSMCVCMCVYDYMYICTGCLKIDATY